MATESPIDEEHLQEVFRVDLPRFGASVPYGLVDGPQAADCCCKSSGGGLHPGLCGVGIHDLKLAHFQLGSVAFYACGNGSLIICPISELEEHGFVCGVGEMLCLVAIDISMNGRVIEQNSMFAHDVRERIEINDEIVSHESGIVSCIRRVFFRNVEQMPRLGTPNGMMHGFEIHARPLKKQPSSLDHSSAYLDYIGHVPIAISERKGSVGYLYFGERTIGLYLPCECDKVRIID